MRAPVKDRSQPEHLAALRSEVLLHPPADQAPIMLWVLAKENRYVYFNRAWLAFTGRRLEDELGSGWLEGVHPDDRDACRERSGQALATGRPLLMEYRLRRADGQYRWMIGHGAPWTGPAGTLLGYFGSSTDITDLGEHSGRPQRPSRSLDAYRQQLAEGIDLAREKERRSLARELHDELGQTLTAIKLELSRATAVFGRERLQPHAVDRLQSLAGLADIGIATVRRIGTSLRPVSLDQGGLLAAIRWEATTFRARTGLRCDVRSSGETTRLTPDQQTMVFRILQEALTNVARHAHASAVHVSVAERRGVFEMRIRDNGAGISRTEETHPQAIGLLGMRERAALAGGTLHIAGRPGKGTSLVVRVTLSGSRAKRRRSRPAKAGGRRKR
jgi:PAS domain S-box-containing protein